MPSLRRGTNLSRIAGYNEAVIIDAIRRSRGGLSRVELAGETGLSAQTVSNIIRRMIDTALVVEGDRVTAGLGKPRTLLALNPGGRYAMGVHLDPLVMTVVVLDFCGDVVAHAQRPTPTAASPDSVLGVVTTAIGELVVEAGIDRTRIAGIGFASPGPVDVASGVILDPPHLPDWRNVPLGDHLHRITGLPVVLDKDVIAAAVGERWAGAALDHTESLFLYLSTGVGVGIISDDTVQRGLTGNAGDIGHLVVAPDGPACACGLRGCLGATLTPRALVAEAVSAGVMGPEHRAAESGDPSEVDRSFDELCRLSRDGDPAARAVIDRSAIHLAKAVSTLANLADTEVVVIGGPTWSRLSDHYLATVPDLVRGCLVRGSLGPPLHVVGTALGEDVVAIGAACLVLDQTYAPNPAAFALQN
jgi:predicted NBD/HSP70 family sugar kinase